MLVSLSGNGNYRWGKNVSRKGKRSSRRGDSVSSNGKQSTSQVAALGNLPIRRRASTTCQLLPSAHLCSF